MNYPTDTIIRRAARPAVLRHWVTGTVGLAALFLVLSLILDERREFLVPLFPCLLILASAVSRLVRIACGREDGDRDHGSIVEPAPQQPKRQQTPSRQLPPALRRDA